MTTEPVHLIADGEAVTSCCGRTPFELPRTDRLTVDPSLAGGCETEIARATRLGFELGKAEGRKQAGEDIAAMLRSARHAGCTEDGTAACDMCWALGEAATKALSIASQPSGGVSNGPTVAPASPGTPKAAEAGREA